jgi:DNA invertase Pin-like site-specific DNA recombinase
VLLSRLMMHIIGAMAEFERELIRELVFAGIQAARKLRIGKGTACRALHKPIEGFQKGVPKHQTRPPVLEHLTSAEHVAY